MKITVSTSKLQDAISKILKGSNDSKLYPITTLMSLQYYDNTLSILSTDYSNYLKVMIKSEVSGDEGFNVSLSKDKFSKLILKTTSEKVTLELCDSNILKVKGNGNYDLELPLDEEGELINFPYPDIDQPLEYSFKLPAMTIRGLMISNESSLATTLENIAMTNYYLDSKQVVSTNAFVVTLNELGLIPNPILVSTNLMSKLDLINDEEVTVGFYGSDIIKITRNDMEVIGKLSQDELEDYPIEDVLKFGSAHFDYFCKINKNTLLNTLDRINLFVEPYDENGVYLSFDKNSLGVINKNSKVSENLPYLNKSDNINDINVVLVQINRLQDILQSLIEDEVTIYYGNSKAIKCVGGKISHILALIEE